MMGTYKDKLTKKFLLEEYIRKGKTIRQIGRDLGYDHTTIAKYLREHGIAIRSAQRKYYKTLLDVDTIIREIPEYKPIETRTKTIEKAPDKENINLIISDCQVGQKLFNETEDEAIEYFNESFITLEDNIAKTISHLNYNWQRLNIFLLGDIVDGEGIYPNQAYESFQLSRQLDIAESGLYNTITGLKERFGVPVNIVGVRGNHGRTRFFSSDESNWDTMLYKLLKRDLHHYNDISFKINDFWADKVTDQFDNVYLVTHGDAIDIHSGMPHYGIDKAAGNWHMIFKGYDVLLMGHFHICVDYVINNAEIYINGCMRFNDYPIRKMKREPIRKFWLFGSGEDRPITWTYKVDVEPEKYRNSLEFGMIERWFGEK